MAWERWVYAVELEPGMCESESVRARNPLATPEARCVYVGIATRGPPAPALQRGDFSVIKKVRYRRAARSYVEGTSSRHTRREGVLSARKRLIAELRSDGYAVVNAPPPEEYSVYVIELDPAPAGAADDQLAVYVGQTGKTPEERMRDHRDGKNSNITAFVVNGRLRPDLLEDHARGLMTQLASLRAERLLRRQLENRGMFVLGGR